MICLLVCALLAYPALSMAEGGSFEETTYAKAIQHMESGQYDVAISVFGIIGDYKDSMQKIADCENAKLAILYDGAMELLEAGEYDAAREAFVMIGDYADCAEKIAACDAHKLQIIYDAAAKLAEQGEYELAMDEFAQLGSFSDSAAQVQQMAVNIVERDYANAFALEQKEQYEQAIDAYQALEGKKDCTDRIAACEHAIAVRELTTSIEAELIKTNDFNAQLCSEYFTQAMELGIANEQIDHWVLLANEQQMLQLYGTKQHSALIANSQGEVTNSVVHSKHGEIVLVKCGKNGVSPLSQTDESYTSMKLVNDKQGRAFVLGQKGDEYHIFLISETLDYISIIGNVEQLKDVTGTELGLNADYQYSALPLRTSTTEYIIRDKDHFTAIDSGVVVNLQNYPKLNSAKTLLTLYMDAMNYDVQAEMDHLLADNADTATLREWLNKNKTIADAQIYAWFEKDNCYVAIVRSGKNEISVALRQTANNTYQLVGEYIYQ